MGAIADLLAVGALLWAFVICTFVAVALLGVVTGTTTAFQLLGVGAAALVLGGPAVVFLAVYVAMWR